MVPAPWLPTTPAPPPSSQRLQRTDRSSLHLIALTLVTTLKLPRFRGSSDICVNHFGRYGSMGLQETVSKARREG